MNHHGRQRILGKWYFLWRNKCNFESHIFRILINYWQLLLKENNAVKTDIDNFLSLCLNFDLKEMIIYFFTKKLPSEAAVRRCYSKKFILKTFSIFTKKDMKAWRPASLLRRYSKTGVFPVTIGQFLRTLFLQHISVAASVHWMNEFSVFTFYLLDLIAVLRIKRQCADFNKFMKV